MIKVLIAIGCIIGGVVLGTVLSAVVRRWLSRNRNESIRRSAKSASGFMFGVLLAIGLVGALAAASPDSIEPLPGDLARGLPKIVVAGLLVIIGRIVGQLVGEAVGRITMRALGSESRGIASAVEWAITGLFVLIAARQIGIDTTVLNILIAALAFGLALAMALLIGLGGRATATQLAAGRSIRQRVSTGDVLEIDDVRGEVTHIGPIAIELATELGTVSVPLADLVDRRFTIVRADSA
jgi:hypothetical protein